MGRKLKELLGEGFCVFYEIGEHKVMSGGDRGMEKADFRRWKGETVCGGMGKTAKHVF